MAIVIWLPTLENGYLSESPFITPNMLLYEWIILQQDSSGMHPTH